MFTEVAPGVFSVASRFVDGKNGIILGSRGALAVDGSNYDDEAQATADFIRQKGYDPNRLALTHGHSDHIFGAAPLAQGEIFAHALTPGVIQKQLPRFAEMRGISVEAAAARVIQPTVTFRDELWVSLGDKTVWLFPTPGHSVDGVSVYVQEVRVLFSGDSVVTGIVAAIGDGNSEVLETSLHRLMTLDIDVLVPGHGHVLYGADKVTDWLTWQGAYLSQVRAEVQSRLARDQNTTAIVEAIDFETFVGDRLPVAQHGMRKRHQATVMKIIAEQIEKRSGETDFRAK